MAAEHAAEAKRLDDSEEFCRMRLAYALLGAAEKQAALAETTEGRRTGCRSPISRP